MSNSPLTLIHRQ